MKDVCYYCRFCFVAACQLHAEPDAKVPQSVLLKGKSHCLVGDFAAGSNSAADPAVDFEAVVVGSVVIAAADPAVVVAADFAETPAVRQSDRFAVIATPEVVYCVQTTDHPARLYSVPVQQAVRYV